MHGRILRPILRAAAQHSCAALLALAPLAALSSLASADPIVPPNFAVDDAAPGAAFVVPTGMAFLPDGRFFVTEKRGEVWEVRNGIKQPTPIWNGQSEVLDQHDRGLLGIAVDPNYFQNHFLYLLYTVDPDSNGSDTNDDAFARLTRYTVNFTDSASVIASSRTILMGYNWPSAPVSASPSHTIGALRWGRDGSLLVSSGDGAQYDFADGGGGQATDAGAFGNGKTDPFYDIGAFRSQDITSLNGKILRINPANGHGYASNPFANSNLASAQSRVYSYGLRNPFRFGVRPNTGSTDTTLGNPGSVYIGDVGWNSFEEMNIARSGGKNFGWPCYEGLGGNGPYQSLNPAHNGCGSFGTPTNPSFPTSPTTSWSHGIPELSDPAGFTGNTSIGGVFYTATNYPVQFRNQYFFADYGQNWIRVCVVDANDNRLQLIDFASSADGPVDLAASPVTGDIYYVSILTGQVRRIRWTGAVGGNTPPVAAISAVPTIGAAPMQVQFSASGSFDPDGDPITYSWLFGDGTSGTGVVVNHTYNSFGLMTAQLTVSDNRGGQGVTTQTITVNPPGTGFPTTGVRDNFNRPDGPIGAPWADATNGLVTSANTLASTAVSNSSVWNGGAFGRNQEVYVTFSNATNAAEQNLMLKVQGTSWASGHIEVSYNATSSRVFVNTYAPGGQGWIGRGSLAASFATGDQFGARADSLGNVVIYKNGTSLGQINVGNWPYVNNGGSIGLTLTGINSTGGTVDNFGGGTVVVSTNSKPIATISQPVNNSFYYTGQTVDLLGSAVDAETASNLLTYQWTVDLYHNNHIHPSVYTFNGPTASFTGENHDDGTGVHMLVKFVATDPQGFHSDTAFAAIWPEIDLQPGAVTVTPSSPPATQAVPISFYIRNVKRMPAPISHWMLRAGAALIAQGDVIVPAMDSVAVNVSAAFPSAGTFPLRLTVDSLATVFETNEGNNSLTASITVSPVAGNNSPTAVVGAVPLSGTAPLNVAFSGAGSSDPDSDPLTYAWTFGDGAGGSGATTNHTYATPGTYTATLTVDDGRGGSGTAHVDITVNAPVNTFPQTVVLDNFNRANGALGGSWVDGVSGLTVNNNQMTQTSADNSVVWNGATFGKNQEAYITFASINNLAPEQNLMLKVQGTSWSAGHIEVAYNGPQARITINTYAPTQGWVGRGQATGVVFQNGDRFGARVDSLGNVEVYKNTTKLGTFSAGNWPFVAAGGRLGLTLSGSSGGFFDDFGGGNVTGTPPVLPDLRVSPVAVTPDPTIATQTAQYAFKIYNRGAANAALSHWVLRANATLLGQGDAAINAGDSTALTVNASLPTTGTWTVRLVADSLAAVNESDESNNASVRALTVNPVPGNNPPVAVAGGTPNSGQAPLTVNFSGAGSSDPDADPLTYSWAFGDGANGSGATTSHQYTTAGSFAAILTVTDGRGGSDTASVPVTVTPAPVTFPLTAVLDNFNRANGGVGSPWTPTTGLTVSANQLKPTVNDISSVWNGATFGANQEAFVRLNAITSNSPEHNLMLKVQGTVWSTGHIEVRYDHQKSKISVSTYDPAVGWVQRGGNLAITLAAGDQFGARALSDGTITVYRNGTQVMQVTATGWAFNGSGGRIGLTLTRTTASLLDDFGGGNVAGPLPLASLKPARDDEPAAGVLPHVLALSSAYPNPARSDVSFTLDLPRASTVDFSIYDVAGREVWSAAPRTYGAGRWSLRWNGVGERGTVPAGVYLARVKVDGTLLLRRLAILR